MLELRSLILLLLVGVYLSLSFIYPYSTFAMYDTNLAILTQVASSAAGPTSDNGYVLLRVELKPHESELLASDGWYRVKSFQLNSSNTEFCPSNNCEYNIENGMFYPSETAVVGEYVFDGKLKVNVTGGNTKTSNIYALQADLKKVGEGSPSKPTEILKGDMNLVETNIGSFFEYKIVNGTLDKNGPSPILFLRAE